MPSGAWKPGEELILPCLEGLTGEALLHSVADKLAALRERGVAFDGLAASSDALAVAALKALTARRGKGPGKRAGGGV